jgi:hypothetical protein
MLQNPQFGRSNPINPIKPKKVVEPKKPTVPGSAKSGGGSSYKFLPPIKSKEELDLMEAKTRSLNAKTNAKYQTRTR